MLKMTTEFAFPAGSLLCTTVSGYTSAEAGGYQTSLRCLQLLGPATAPFLVAGGSCSLRLPRTDLRSYLFCLYLAGDGCRRREVDHGRRLHCGTTLIGQLLILTHWRRIHGNRPSTLSPPAVETCHNMHAWWFITGHGADPTPQLTSATIVRCACICARDRGREWP